MRYLTSNTYVSPGKEQIRTVLAKVKRVFELYKPIVLRLQEEEVEVTSWFGLRRKVMTKDKHILKENKNSFLTYYNRALLMGYITEEEHTICSFIMDAPLLTKLEEWESADTVYLGEFDHNEFMFALKEEI